LQWGVAMGQEWYNKGANIQLGPGVNLARLPNNGRLWEYVSGEDPHLGFHMSKSVVSGIQSQGVIATAKHYVDNSQETNRGHVTEVVDERTQFELYYPPFEGAIAAGLGAVMCAYNKVCLEPECSYPTAIEKGRWSCENHESLQRDLKGRLKFQGLVMSDWDATRSSASILAGLDMEMNSAGDGKYFNASILAAMLQNGSLVPSTIQESATRILWPLFQVGLMDQPNRNGSIYHNVSSGAHINLARTIAAESTVLLQNRGLLLPLKLGVQKRMAVIGATAVHPIIHGTGSAQVAPAYTPTPLDSLRDALSIPSGDTCNADGICVEYADGANVSQAVQLAESSDVVIVFVGSASGEGQDRANLTLSGGQDRLIAAVGQVASTKSAVVAVCDGAILTPWRDVVASILIPFMPGQEFGHAITDVLLGRTPPSGKLPVSFPAMRNEVGFTNISWGKSVSNYSEGLHVGYRYYSAHKRAPAFAFGSGETYTTFTFTQLRIKGCNVSFLVTNTGFRPGRQVAQLYLRFPASTGEDFIQLKGFEKVRLDAGQSTRVSFALDDRSFSIWDTNMHAWAVASGQFAVQVGGSSADASLAGAITVRSEAGGAACA
jgi:beta-glucosidase